MVILLTSIYSDAHSDRSPQPGRRAGNAPAGARRLSRRNTARSPQTGQENAALPPACRAKLVRQKGSNNRASSPGLGFMLRGMFLKAPAFILDR